MATIRARVRLKIEINGEVSEAHRIKIAQEACKELNSLLNKRFQSREGTMWLTVQEVKELTIQRKRGLV